MIRITISENDGEQRLDRFLRKYLSSAPLSGIHKMIRRDVKVNGRRAAGETRLRAGDELTLYISDELLAEYTKKEARKKAGRRTFQIAYEDDQILAAVKPAGLLVHGDGKEKKDTLVNQVTDYLIAKGDYVPRAAKTFSPAAANRLDRNTSGLVLFGKNAAALRALAEMIRQRSCISKRYLTVVAGDLREDLHLTGMLEKDEQANRVTVTGYSGEKSGSGDHPEFVAASAATGSRTDGARGSGRYAFAVTDCRHERVYGSDKNEAADSRTDRDRCSGKKASAAAGSRTDGARGSGKREAAAGKAVETIVRPLVQNGELTMAEVELITGRTHQIRAHLAAAGYPVIGDAKYGSAAANRKAAEKYGLQHQFLHAYKLVFNDAEEPLDNLRGKSIISALPKKLQRMAESAFGTEWMDLCGLREQRQIRR